MEDTHVWVMAADGTNRREVGTVDNRQGAPEWSHDGRLLYVTMQERGDVRLIRAAAGGGAPERLVADRGSVGQWALARRRHLIYGFTTPARPAELYVRTPAGQARAVTTLNQERARGEDDRGGRGVHLRELRRHSKCRRFSPSRSGSPRDRRRRSSR